jgi:hypothetical protein
MGEEPVDRADHRVVRIENCPRQLAIGQVDALNRHTHYRLQSVGQHARQRGSEQLDTLNVNRDDVQTAPHIGLRRRGDHRSLTPLFWSHVNSYGEVRLNMQRPLNLSSHSKRTT